MIAIRFISRRISTIVIPFMILLLTGSIAGQVVDINVGNFHLRWDESARMFGEYVDPVGYWSAGWYRRANIEGIRMMSALTHIDRYTNDNNLDEGITSYDRRYGSAASTRPVAPIREVRRVMPPTVIVDGVPARPYTGEVDPDITAPQIVETKNKGSTSSGGAWHKLKIYAFENPKYDDFLIFDYTLTLKFDWDEYDTLPDGPAEQTVEGWFGMRWNLQPCWAGRVEYGRSFYNTDELNTYMIRQSELVTPGSTPRDSLLISYACDINDPMYEEWDDYGDPDRETGELISPMFIGFATLHADRSVDDHTDDSDQPINAINRDLDTEVWTGTYPGGAIDGYEWATTPARYESRVGPNPWTIDPDITNTEMGNLQLQFHGPYEMELGDSIRYVFALGAGSIDPVYALELGREWIAGDITDIEKDSTLYTGKDSLFKTLDKAYWAWTNYINTGDFGIPKPSPAPDIEVTSGPGCNYVKWGYTDPDMFPDDFQEWRVYHKQGHFLVAHPDDIPFQDYELIYRTTDVNITEYTDTAVVRGQPYHYIATVVNTGGVESSRFANRTLYAATPFKPGSPYVDSVRIVPNPYIISGKVLNFAEPNKIAFFGLPPYCTLKIYNEFGDLVEVIEHTSGSADESWDQITKSNQFLASGVYILSVQNAKDMQGNSMLTKNHKFVIIR